MSQPSEESRPPAIPRIDPEFSRDERKVLLHLAHEAILSSLERREICLPPLVAHLREMRRAVFTTLYTNGQLRGCVGHVVAFLSLDQAVTRTARAAAFDDSRFPPVSLAEASGLEISLSVLSPLFAIRAQEIIIGHHGLLVSQGGLRGLLLPQVSVEQSWDAATFLQQTCKKAGLPADAWQHDATLQAFTAEIFSDGDP